MCRRAVGVEVILLSRNSADTGLRVFNSIQHHGLDVRRATFTSGAPVALHPALRRAAVPVGEPGIGAARAGRDHRRATTILPWAQAKRIADEQLRIAFDGDAVIFGDEGEARVARARGSKTFGAHERGRPANPVGQTVPQFPRRAAPAAGAFPGRGGADPHRAGPARSAPRTSR